ncbi:MAG: endolytic transglycosylase MltG [Candidatus Campbellbacteria bacterium]|nr:endolytic transglycosylase MltG [Candidatus Campbellbacteria bacterium]
MSRNMMMNIGVVCGVVLLLILLHTPKPFPEHSLVNIPEGASFVEAASLLKGARIITSTTLLRVLTEVIGGAENIRAGDYLFKKPQGTLAVAYRLTHGDYRLEQIKVVLPEGITVATMADILSKNLPAFDKQKFFSLAYTQEGFLFPDTYFFFVNTTPEDVLSTLSKKSDTILAEYADAIASSSRSLEEIVTMASIIEEEARGREDQRSVSGILWKRFDVGMALQVDATFAYTLGKESHELTSADLELDSPYNSYTRVGLPPTPISNPGRSAIEAALSPTKTPYWYYLNGKDGVTHYAETFEEHKQNKETYL